ncbi:MAG: polysaccharide deacetylase family protein [Defluviitaleaceae bacterium]|nr:polysaccharide deacetylase family protein [Defluviitaleaceae bacterium]
MIANWSRITDHMSSAYAAALTPSPAAQATPLSAATPAPEAAAAATPSKSPTPTPDAATEPPSGAPAEETPAPETQSPTPSPTTEPTATLTGDPAAPPGGDASGLDNTMYSWYFMKNSDHQPTRGAAEVDISQYDGHYLGDTTQKVIYLTFDEGYEEGYTPSILDTLKEKGVKAAFFMTQTFMRDNPDLVQRISDEGHVCADHSVTHPNLPEKDDDQVAYEITYPADYFKSITGKDLDPFFRPPNGAYSVRTLYMTEQLGYKTIFWSYAYQDWITTDQPGKDVAYNNVMNNLHPGEILLLHAVSESNTEALPDIIDAILAQGYQFKSLYDLP